MKAVLKHSVAAVVILALALAIATLSSETYRILKHPNIVRHEAVDFNIGLVFIVAFVLASALLAGLWIWLRGRRKLK